MTSQRPNMSTRSNMSIISKTQLNSRGCLSLAQIIDAFQTSITEEFAWALGFQLAKCGQQILTAGNTRQRCLLLTSPDQLLVHKDGMVHSDSLLSPNPDDDDDEADLNPAGEPRVKCSQEQKLISNMAVVIFLALDHGLPDDLERIINPDLETFLDGMLSAEDEDGDHQGSNCNFSQMIQFCTHHLGKCKRSGEALSVDAYYRDICRNYVNEALELYIFLEKVANCFVYPDNPGLESENEGSKNEGLAFIDWARHWTDVIRALRKGVKLNKVCCGNQPLVPQLTPYEMLMEDIRGRRYKLKKVVTEESRPPMRENGIHEALVMELTGFIPARMRKVADRILNPRPIHEPTPVEKLMTSIIRHEHRLSQLTHQE